MGQFNEIELDSDLDPCDICGADENTECDCAEVDELVDSQSINGELLEDDDDDTELIAINEAVEDDGVQVDGNTIKVNLAPLGPDFAGMWAANEIVYIHKGDGSVTAEFRTLPGQGAQIVPEPPMYEPICPGDRNGLEYRRDESGRWSFCLVEFETGRELGGWVPTKAPSVPKKFRARYGE